MKYKAVIFDLDGVLCHTDNFHFMAWKIVADKCNISFDEQINNRLRGVSRLESLDIILEKSKNEFSYEEKLKLADEKNSIYVKLLENMTSKDVTNEVINTLEALKEKGIKLAIGSSSKNAVFILEKLEIKEYFDAISDGNNIEFSKPHPEVFIKAASFLGFEPNECLVVEDAISGIKAAFEGGFDSAAISDAKKSDLATYKIDRLSELINIFQFLNNQDMKNTNGGKGKVEQ